MHFGKMIQQCINSGVINSLWKVSVSMNTSHAKVERLVNIIKYYKPVIKSFSLCLSGFSPGTPKVHSLKHACRWIGCCKLLLIPVPITCLWLIALWIGQCCLLNHREKYRVCNASYATRRFAHSQVLTSGNPIAVSLILKPTVFWSCFCTDLCTLDN